MPFAPADDKLSFMPSDSLFIAAQGVQDNSVVFVSVGSPGRALTCSASSNTLKKSHPLQLQRATGSADQQWVVTDQGLRSHRSGQIVLGVKVVQVKSVKYDDIASEYHDNPYSVISHGVH